MADTLLSKAKAAIAALFTDADKATIEKFKAELAEAVAPPATEPLKAKTKEGVEMVIEGELKEGSKISMVNPENGELMAAMDGEYEMEDGSKVSVTGGLITKIEKKQEEAPATETEMAAKLSEQVKGFELKLSESIKPLQDVIDSQKKQIETLLSQQKFLIGKFEEMSKTPVITEEVTPAKKWEDMTALERRRAEKNK
jgi:hypothetical protein